MTKEEERREGVRHFMIDVLPVPALCNGNEGGLQERGDGKGEEPSAKVWLEGTLDLLEEGGENRLVVGGTSMYVDWLVKGTPNNRGWNR